jgi:hypothetical protein
VNEGGDFVKAWDVANQLAIAKAYDEYGVKKTFSFHSRVKQAKDFVSDGVQGIGSHLKDVECRSVDGSMNIGERRKIMEVIKDRPRALLANARCLTEGVNLPSVDCVAFLSPKKSRIDVAQAMGRGMRKNGFSKKTGYVIVPLYVALAEGESYEDAIERARFDTVLEVLQTLKEIDESFADFLKELAQPKKRAKGSSDWKLSEHIEFSASPMVLLEGLANTIRLACIDELIPSWEKRFAELVVYKEIHGHCNVPQTYGPLGLWGNEQRQHKGRLSSEQVARLEAIGFCWNPLEAAWEKMFALLVAYKEIHGDCNVPRSHGPLGSWCNQQRYKKGQLSEERIARLEAIGFCWNPHDVAWEQKFAELVAYKKVHGHCNVPSRNPLGNWCQNQRTKKGRLSQERIARLEAEGFSWSLIDAAWEQNFAELVAYKEIHGHCSVPQSYGPLGWWCGTQRQRKYPLSPEQVARLEAIGFCWNTINAAWEQKFVELVAYKEIHGHCNVPQRCPLGAWCTWQRQKKGQLSQERIARLEAIGFCWNTIDAAWEKMFALLVTYKESHGHCNVPQRSILGHWCSTQRQNKDWLSPERIAKLEAEGFSWDPYSDAWKKRFALLVAYKEIHGHCNVPRLHGLLGNWCHTQRERCKKGKLSSERIAQLDALGFCWDLKAARWNETIAELIAYKEATFFRGLRREKGASFRSSRSQASREWEAFSVTPENMFSSQACLSH